MIKKGVRGKDKPTPPAYVFKLFVTGSTPNSLRAINNIQQICETHLPGQFELEIIDVYQQPSLAQSEQIIALPLLIKKMPLPERKMIGDLSQTEKILKIIGLT